MIVVADDFTGAAEIAAASFARGYSSAVLREPFPPNTIVRHTVLDTDTRLKERAESERSIQSALSFIAQQPTQRIFKKVDSVLRGNVATELALLAQSLGRPRIILHPANPSAGRAIENQVYLINGTPIASTEFSKDPTHPATSSDPLDLLGPVPDFQIHYCRHSDELPESGIIVCESSSAQDVAAWAKRLATDDLPAGGRDFFEAILSKEKAPSVPDTRHPYRLPSACLLIQGTVSPEREKLHHSLAASPYLRISISPKKNEASLIESACDTIAASLTKKQLVTLEFKRLDPVPQNAAQEIEKTIKAILKKIRSRPSILTNGLHLAIDGGATAALILDNLKINELQVEQLWAGGVVSLTSPDFEKLVITTKPGSYPWPESIVKHFASHR